MTSFPWAEKLYYSKTRLGTTGGADDHKIDIPW